MTMFYENFTNGDLLLENDTKDLSDIEWIPHKKFKGVFLKNIIKGENTDNIFSAHIVKIEPNSTLEMHCHPDNMELHEVIHGNGSLFLYDKTEKYYRGKIALINKNEKHEVTADEKGLYLLAKFFPALA